MAIDASIPLQASQNQQQINPLGMIGQYAQIQNAVNQNRLFQSRQAAGQAFLNGGINSDGTPNQAGLLQALKADPNTAMAAQEAAGQGQALSQAQMTQQFQRLNYISGINAQLLSQPGQINPGDVQKAVSAHVGDGIFTPDQAQQVLSTLPQDPTQIRPWLMQHQIANLQASQQLAAILPQNMQQDTGSGIRTIDTNPITNPNGPGSTGTSVGKTLPPTWIDNGPNITPTNAGAPTGPGVKKAISPSEAASRTVIDYDPRTGAPISGPLQSVTPQSLGGTAGTMGSGRYLPKSLLNSASPAAQGIVGGAPGPGQQAALTTTGGDSAKAFQDISQQGVQARSQGALLNNMLADTSQFTTGPGQQDVKHFQSVLQRVAPNLATAFGVKPESIAANESFDKFANQLANAQGAGSDARLAVNQGSNPSSINTPAGVDMILRQLIGNAQYVQARGQLAAAYGDKTDSQGFEAKIGQQLDPRAFQYAQMTPQQRATFFNAMPAASKAAFKKAYGFAEQNGLLTNAGQ